MPDAPAAAAPAVPFDPASLAPMIGQAVQAAIATESAKAQQEAQAAIDSERARQAAQARSEAQPLRKVILDEIGGDLGHLKTEIASAKDAAAFYSSTPEAAAHKAAIEKTFDQLIASGRPTDRDTVFKWYKGQNFDLFHKARIAQDEEARIRAAQGLSPTSLGSGSRGGAPVDPWAMTPEELDKAMKGAEF